MNKIEITGPVNGSVITAGNGNVINSIISQKSEFEKLEQGIRDNISSETDREALLQAVIELRKNRENKGSYRKAYDKFMGKAAQYMNIAGPFIPYLFSLLGE